MFSSFCRKARAGQRAVKASRSYVCLMNERFRNAVCSALGCSDFRERETIQSLWSGYGKISRLDLVGGDRSTVVLKLVRPPSENDHPRGWNTDISHQRKLKSYEVESAWYADFARNCDEKCKVPQCFAIESEGGEVMIVLEDLDASGFSGRRSSPSTVEMEACLHWLANFHATFIGCKPEGLWKKGTYWHLDTRPDELEVLSDLELKAAAGDIDQALENCGFKTLVHGDAKLANFCFSEDGGPVAAVDFQYVGGGCGMKDVAYFIGSCLNDTECERMEQQLLDYYFVCLQEALAGKRPDLDFGSLHEEWRDMYHVAWADFHRFLKGWSPGHWKIHSYSERVTRDVLERLPK